MGERVDCTAEDKSKGVSIMDYQSFKEKVLDFHGGVNELLRTVSNPSHIELLNEVVRSLKLYVEFVNDEQNLKVLYNSGKKGEKEEKCPLDSLCEKVTAELEKIYISLKKEIFDFMRLERSTEYQLRQGTQSIIELNGRLTEIRLTNIISAYEILKHLEGHNKTLIILGPNGSGKTTFANYIKGVENHIKVIPASKPTMATGYMPSIYNSMLDNFNDEIYQGGVLKEDLLQKLIIGICSEHDSMARKYYDTGVKGEETTYQKVKKIFDDFFDVKLDNSAFGDKQIKAKKDEESPFEFNRMSDGERVAFFYIATVIAAPKGSFIVVDEPENHLNPAIYNKIWDRLIAVRGDCQFIFISHTMEFINARSNFELVKIKRFVRPNYFEFEFLGDKLDEIQPELIVEIVGSRKPILFCEGSKTDYDYKIYEIIFGNRYTVIPTGNCLSVRNSVEACNMHATTYSIQSAIGIIDSDLKSEEEIDRLKVQNVFSLRCNEIEMLLLDEAIFKKVLKQIFKDETEFDTFKNAFFTKLTERKQHIVKRLVKTQIDEVLRNSIIDDKNNKTKDEIKNNLNAIFSNLNVDVLWSNCETKISEIIAQRDYEEALRYCCLEHTEIIVGVANRFVMNYAVIALGVLREDEELAIYIKRKYFSEISE